MPEQKTITSFDLQLYAKAVLLQANPEIRNNFVFRMGELHAVFCFLKVLGKMIDGSGLDQSFEEARNLFDFFINSSSEIFRFFCSFIQIYAQPNLKSRCMEELRIAHSNLYFPEIFTELNFSVQRWRNFNHQNNVIF